MTSLRLVVTTGLAYGVAYAQAGVHEQGDNRGDQVEWFQHAAGGVAGESWCADFAYACYLKAWCHLHGLLTGATAHDNRVIMLAHADAMSAETGIPRTSYCPTVAKVAKHLGRLRGRDFMPSPGDIVLFRFDKRPEPHHCGIVIDPRRSVQGNTSRGSSGSQDNGEGVYVKMTQIGNVWGYVHFAA